MRILHLISSGGMYGAEAVILNLCSALKQFEGHEGMIGVFVNSSQQNLTLYHAAIRIGVRCYQLPCNGPLDLSVSGAIRDLVKQTQADIVHTHGYKANVYAWSALRRRSVPLVATCHTWYDNDLALRVYGVIDRWTLRSFDAVIAVSNEVRDRLLLARVPAKRIHLVKNGIDLEPFKKASNSGRLQNPDENSFRIGLVGRLAPEKGVDVFLRAMSQIAQQRPAVRFLIAGDGPDEEELMKLTRGLGLSASVTFAGVVSDMVSFYASLDLLVSASRNEGLPIALLEAMASRLPIVATSVGAVPQLIHHRATGLLVEPDDPTALATAVNHLLEDGALRESLADSARKLVSAEFSAVRMSDDYLKIYHAASQTKLSA